MTQPRLLLTLISNDAAFAKAATAAGIDRVLIDLELRGKAERQSGRALFLSTHAWTDIAKLRAVVPRDALIVRLDPLHDDSRDQIDRAIASGADRLMLPYFHDAATVLHFVDLAAGRVPVVPLVETASAVDDLDRLLAARAVQEFHVGLNDLALDLGRPSLNTLWGDPILDRIAAIAAAHGSPFGVGGVTDPRLPGLPVDPKSVIGEQRRLGSTRALLGRHFRAPYESAPDEHRIRAAIDAIQTIYGGAIANDCLENRPSMH